MTYAEWKSAVLSFLDVDATRRGIEALRSGFMRSAMADLKHFVPCYNDGRASYEDTDEVPFGERAAEAAAMYVKARLVRATERNPGLIASFETDYIKLRRQLIRDCQDGLLSNPVDYTLVCPRGDTFAFELILRVGNNVFDPTGHTVRFTVKEDACDTDEDAIMLKSSAATVDEPVPAITTLIAAQGKMLVSLDKDDTALLAPDVTYLCDAQLELSTGEIYTVFRGRIRSSQDVSR